MVIYPRGGRALAGRSRSLLERAGISLFLRAQSEAGSLDGGGPDLAFVRGAMRLIPHRADGHLLQNRYCSEQIVLIAWSGLCRFKTARYRSHVATSDIRPGMRAYTPGTHRQATVIHAR